MFLNDSHIERDWLDVDSNSQQATMKKAANSAAGLYCITIKGISPGECHYLSTSIYVQMAPNLLLPPPTTTGSVCVWRCVCGLIVIQTNAPDPTIKIFFLSMVLSIQQTVAGFQNV